MRCILCGRNEDDVADKSLAIGAQINKALDILENNAIENKGKIDVLLQRKKALDRITFTCVSFSDETVKILEKYSVIEKSNDDNAYLICMHCKFIIDNMQYCI